MSDIPLTCNQPVSSVKLKSKPSAKGKGKEESQPKPSTFLTAFYNSERYSDVVIKVKDTPFYGHRLVLSQSGYFEGLFNSKMKETSARVDGKFMLELNDITPRYFEIYLHNLYGIDDLPINIEFGECLDLYRETERFLTASFNQNLQNKISQFREKNLTFHELVMYHEFIYTYNLECPEYTAKDLKAPVLYSLSYPAVLYLITRIPNSSYIPVIVWIATHQDTPTDQLKKLIDTARPTRLKSEEIATIMTYREVPLLKEYILDLMSNTITKSCPDTNQWILSKTYSYVLEIKRQIDEGIPLETDPVSTKDASLLPMLSNGKLSVAQHLIGDRTYYRTIVNDFILEAMSDGKVRVIGRYVNGVNNFNLTDEEIAVAKSIGLAIDSN